MARYRLMILKENNEQQVQLPRSKREVLGYIEKALSDVFDDEENDYPVLRMSVQRLRDPKGPIKKEKRHGSE